MKLTFKIYMQPDADFEIDAEPFETIADVKAKIKASHGHDIEKQNIIFCGRNLENDRTLESCRVSEKGFLVFSVTKPIPPLPVPRELEAAEYFDLDEDAIAEWLGTIPLSQITSRTTSELTTSDSEPKLGPLPPGILDFEASSDPVPPLKYESTRKDRLLFSSGVDSETTPVPVPPTTTGSNDVAVSSSTFNSDTASPSVPSIKTGEPTFKYRPFSSSIFGSDTTTKPLPPLKYESTFKYRPFTSSTAGSGSTSTTVPPTTTESTFKYSPLSSSMLSPDTASGPVPPLKYESTFKYRPFTSSTAGSGSSSTPAQPATTESTFKHHPLSSSIFNSDTVSGPVPPTTTESTFKYRPFASPMAGSSSTSTGVPPTTAGSTFKYRPMSSPSSVPGSGSMSASDTQSTSRYRPISASVSSAGPSQNMLQQGNPFGAGITPRLGSGSSGDTFGRGVDPRMAQFRQLLTENAGLRQHFIQQLAQEHPELGQLFTQHPDMLFHFLDRIEAGETSHDPQVSRLSVTEAEQGAIERLEALGFSKQAVMEAYFACDKNEELAANYLLENAS